MMAEEEDISMAKDDLLILCAECACRRSSDSRGGAWPGFSVSSQSMLSFPPLATSRRFVFPPAIPLATQSSDREREVIANSK
jgi:hypothetical protein